MKILLVEDSLRIREMLNKTFRKTLSGYEVSEAETLSRARELISEKQFDLAILDLNLPDGSGCDLIEELKRDKSVNVIVFTNSISNFIRSKCLENGADYFFNKASDFEILINTIESLQPVM